MSEETNHLIGVCDCGGIGQVCICTECGWKGCDTGTSGRVCDLEGHDEPEGDEHEQHCPVCDKEVWWLPKCPNCGCGCDWTYTEDDEVHPYTTQKKARAI
jgi:hypothetical protein